MYIVESVLYDENSSEAIVVISGERLRITKHDLDVLGIVEGDSVDEMIRSAVIDAVERLACIKKAFDFLSYGDLSEKQLRDKLCRKYSNELSADVASLFVERGYVNDAKLAKRYAETFYELKNMGLSRIRNELYKRGISREDIEDALAEYENEDQSDRIEAFIRKKYDIDRINDIKYRQKVYAGTLRAGFSGSDVGEVLRKFESE